MQRVSSYLKMRVLLAYPIWFEHAVAQVLHPRPNFIRPKLRRATVEVPRVVANRVHVALARPFRAPCLQQILYHVLT
jgi:hypothetical protein